MFGWLTEGFSKAGNRVVSILWSTQNQLTTMYLLHNLCKTNTRPQASCLWVINGLVVNVGTVCDGQARYKHLMMIILGIRDCVSRTHGRYGTSSMGKYISSF